MSVTPKKKRSGVKGAGLTASVDEQPLQSGSPVSKKERRYGCWWVCCDKEFPSVDEMKAHLLEVHKIDGSKTQGTRSMLAHMDGADWFSWDYKWEYPGLTFTQHTCQKRDKASRMNWQD